ncbi:MAG: hypothetical protein EA370_10285 [Wenzhouxiangella sp.]|nr:MAG: hypothetical protein EA370_10285 [Wenzhouxiangella sp.]
MLDRTKTAVPVVSQRGNVTLERLGFLLYSTMEILLRNRPGTKLGRIWAADALDGCAYQPVNPGQRQGQVRAAFTARQGVKLVDHDGLDAAQ